MSEHQVNGLLRELEGALSALTASDKSPSRGIPVNDLLHDLGGVLSALTASEKLWVREIRRLRLSRQPEAPPSQGVAPASSSPPLQALESMPSSTTRVSAAAPSTSTPPPSPTYWPVAAEEIGAAPTTVKRSYNYFAELDEKLAGLREQSLQPGGH